MPYITEPGKVTLDGMTFRSICNSTLTAGDITYLIFKLLKSFAGEKPRFIDYALVLGCVQAALLEFYRRCVGPYEDEKIKENGDVE